MKKKTAKGQRVHVGSSITELILHGKLINVGQDFLWIRCAQNVSKQCLWGQKKKKSWKFILHKIIFNDAHHYSDLCNFILYPVTPLLRRDSLSTCWLWQEKDVSFVTAESQEIVSKKSPLLSTPPAVPWKLIVWHLGFSMFWQVFQVEYKGLCLEIKQCLMSAFWAPLGPALFMRQQPTHCHAVLGCFI